MLRFMSQPLKITGRVRLRDFDSDYCAGLDKERTRAKTAKLCQRIGELQERFYSRADRSLVLLFQGMDTSGKDGAVKRVLEFVNPAGVETTNFKAPSSEERAHDFLWRIHRALPRRGWIGVFNRSHYEDVLVVRVLGLQPKPVWQARYEQINAFENILAANGVILLKFFLQISKAEQAERLRARLADPAKNWKYSESDIKERDCWNDYMEAYESLLNETSSKEAPWYVVPADQKWLCRAIVSRILVQTVDGLNAKYPQASEEQLASLEECRKQLEAESK